MILLYVKTIYPIPESRPYECVRAMQTHHHKQMKQIAFGIAVRGEWGRD